MTCAIMQPTYIPWIGYFDLIDQVDIFVFLDDVQLTKRSWQTRNRILGQNGELFLTIPIVKDKSRSETKINNALIDNSQKWKEKHLKSIFLNYKKAQNFETVYPLIKETFLCEDYQKLSEYNINLIKTFSSLLNLKTKFINSSSLNITGSKDEYLANICTNLNCINYLSAFGSSSYIEKDSPGGKIVEQGIELTYHQYEHPVYKQTSHEFIPYLSIIDLLLNAGVNEAMNIIRSGRKKPLPYNLLKPSQNS